jgi:hypothetical protein
VPPYLQLRLDNLARNDSEYKKLFGGKLPIEKAKRSKAKRVSDDDIHVHDTKSDCNVRRNTLRTILCRKNENASNVKRAIPLSDYESDVSDASYNYEKLTNNQMKEQDFFILSKLGQTFTDRFQF